MDLVCRFYYTLKAHFTCVIMTIPEIFAVTYGQNCFVKSTPAPRGQDEGQSGVQERQVFYSKHFVMSMLC
jgi:hypothetical protein